MNLMVSVERRYQEYNGRYYVSGIEDDDFFCRYLDSFKKVLVVARVTKSKDKPEGTEVFVDKDIDVVPVYTKGTGLTQFFKLMTILNSADYNVLLIRTPGILAYLLSFCCIFITRKYNLEIVTNPKQESKHATRFKALNYLFSIILPFIFKVQVFFCKHASFVTSREIQNDFLSQRQKTLEKFKFNYSSISIGDSFYCSPDAKNKQKEPCDGFIRLLFVGVLERNFKGLDTFIELIANLPDNYKADVVGDGKLFSYYIAYAEKLNVSDRITFHGYISDVEKKKALFRGSDIFVLTSRREGLPRVVIEAMSNSLPCVCTDVSGVRELISEEFIFPIDDYIAASEILKKLDATMLRQMSEENFQRSQNYHNKKLTRKRVEYYEVIKGC